MKLFTVLVLCCSFFSSSTSPLPTQDADCDDPDVFKAVEIALRKYNADKTDGNQFALYMVMEAKRTTGPGKHFFVKYRIRESSCAVGGDKLWQDCDYRASSEAESGECTAHVYIDKAEDINNITQECKIVPVEGRVTVSHAECLGCYHPIPVNSLQLLPILRYAIRVFNKEADHPSLFEVGEIIKATRQVVAGWNYAIEYEVKETNCSKDNFEDLSPACKPIFGGRVALCEAKAYVDLQNAIVDVAQRCKFPVVETVTPPISICVGCPRPIPTNSVELEEPLRASLKKYNEDSNDDFYYKAEAITHATVQVVAGKNYNITFQIRKTNCSKSAVTQLNEDCQAAPDSKPLQCTAQVYVVPWLKTIYPKVNCLMMETILARRPPGLTPFRSLAVEPKIIQTTPQIKHKEGPKEGQTLDKESGKDRCESKHGHEDEHGHSCQHGHRHGSGFREEHGQKHGQGHEDEHGHSCQHGHKDEHGHRRGSGFRKEHGQKRGHGHEDEHGHRHEDKQGHKQGPEHGRRHGHGKHKDKQKNRKDKHKESKDDSSEECHDEVTNQKETLLETAERSEDTLSFTPDLTEPGVLPISQPTRAPMDGFPEIFIEIPDLPAEPDSTGIIPDITSFPELPESPKCPGKPWKPIADLTMTTGTYKPKVLTDEDLLPHPSEDTHPEVLPTYHSSADFDLRDLIE